MDMPDRSTRPDEYHPYVLQSLPESEPELEVPFARLTGERVSYLGQLVNGNIVLTNYRLFVQNADRQNHVPLGLLDTIEQKDLFHLQVMCKDARSFKCSFETNESALEWYTRITKAIEPSKQLNQLFAFIHFKAQLTQDDHDGNQYHRNYVFDRELFNKEMKRLQFTGDAWRVCEANAAFKLCQTYPPFLLVPSSITDDQLEQVAKFRSSKRIPAVVWRHTGNGAVIARCSQPEIGFFGWRSNEDEILFKNLSAACKFSDPKSSQGDSSLSASPNSIHSAEYLQIPHDMAPEKKVLIMDARSYATALANRARGGGCECPDYYPNCNIEFMNLANIHTIRKSFHSLRQLCMSSADQHNWYSLMENTKWLFHMSVLMKAAIVVVNAIEREGRPVVVHCSDGWDRTPQIVALAELLLDPYYRTMEGFRILVEREWLAFGHKFADRCGHTTGSEDPNERCPVFLQWLDCVHQVHKQYSCNFEFTQAYLVKLAQHTYSNLFGTFLCNTQRERNQQNVYSSTFSVWDFLISPRFKNHLYSPQSNVCKVGVLWPDCNVRDLRLWSEVYLGSLEMSASVQGAPGPGPPRTTNMIKTRSYGDLINTNENTNGHFRRSSDPSINVEPNPSDLENGNVPPKPPAAEETPPDPVILMTDPNLPVDFLLDMRQTDETDCPTDCLAKLAIEKPFVGPSAATAAALEPHLGNGDINGKVTSARVLVNGTTTIISAIGNGVGSLAGRDIVINGDKTEDDDVDDCEDDVHNDDDDSKADSVFAICNNCNGALVDTDNSESETPELESKSELTVCDIAHLVDYTSIETSTDTLVSDQNISCSPLRRDFVRLPPDPLDHMLPFEMDGLDGEPPRRESPNRSRTSSASDWDNSINALPRPAVRQCGNYPLGDDGLVPLRSAVQERLQEIIEEHKKKEEQLQRELHVYRLKLAKQVCHRCETEKQDETSDSDDESPKRSLARSPYSCSPSPKRHSSPVVKKAGSVAEGSVCSVGEGPTSAVESLRSDMSWEAVEDTQLSDCPGALWVPDYAVSRCMGCDTKFWLGKRKHHCRNCGKIFCSDCSENTTPLPSDQMFNPVRVCASCYSKLRRDCAELPDQCKHYQASTANPQQIAASSN